MGEIPYFFQYPGKYLQLSMVDDCSMQKLFCFLCALDKNIDRSDHCADQRSKIDDCLKLVFHH